MSKEDAFVVSRDMPARGAQAFRVPYHYLVYAEAGTLTLEADGQRWTLPPARAGLVAAEHEVMISLKRPVRICSALIRPMLMPAPVQPLSVFAMSPLGRELLFALRSVGEETPLDDHAASLVQALALETLRLARHPTRAVMPVPRDERVRKALDLIEARLDQPLRMRDVARDVALSERSLARKLMTEIGMNWSEAQRRLRMIRAVELLSETREPVTGIALAVGYASPSAFGAAFRDFAGQSPSEFRADGSIARP